MAKIVGRIASGVLGLAGIFGLIVFFVPASDPNGLKQAIAFTLCIFVFFLVVWLCAKCLDLHKSSKSAKKELAEQKETTRIWAKKYRNEKTKLTLLWINWQAISGMVDEALIGTNRDKIAVIANNKNSFTENMVKAFFDIDDGGLDIEKGNY